MTREHTTIYKTDSGYEMIRVNAKSAYVTLGTVTDPDVLDQLSEAAKDAADEMRSRLTRFEEASP